jgi:hypothetical protein
MKINRCKLSILSLHKWDYNKERTYRKCQLCGKEMELLWLDEASGLANSYEWFTVQKK